ncbi:hypothetical protein HYALB_00004796 [Hymenoscyphus albidus]|uniref:Copper transport protein n=1 Tax=Hymenoscyphus albidus TaxID=595503 RepID=A0A9N9Q534_9HELO|nr:hypothetical protein HYALB_00004796 [Hymenoscyphus albidus]
MDHSHMDHSMMDHSKMDHSAMGHGSPSAEAMCSMSMLFTWNTKNLCLVFRWWHIQTTPGLIFSLLAVVALTAAYEALRSMSRRYERAVNRKVQSTPTVLIDGEAITERTPFLWSGKNQAEISRTAHVVKALFYAVQNFYAFMLMLLFMTYNGWVMIAMGIGAFIGYLMFGLDTPATKDSACH